MSKNVITLGNGEESKTLSLAVPVEETAPSEMGDELEAYFVCAVFDLPFKANFMKKKGIYRLQDTEQVLDFKVGASGAAADFKLPAHKTDFKNFICPWCGAGTDKHIYVSCSKCGRMVCVGLSDETTFHCSCGNTAPWDKMGVISEQDFSNRGPVGAIEHAGPVGLYTK